MGIDLSGSAPLSCFFIAVVPYLVLELVAIQSIVNSVCRFESYLLRLPLIRLDEEAALKAVGYKRLWGSSPYGGVLFLYLFELYLLQ